MTLYYVALWFIMMLTGILMYEQPLIRKTHNNKFLAALQQIGWMIMFIAMLGCIHGILSLAGLIQPL